MIWQYPSFCYLILGILLAFPSGKNKTLFIKTPTPLCSRVSTTHTDILQSQAFEKITLWKN